VIEIDYSHRQLILGLVVASKPKKLLELGYGTGLTTKTLILGMIDNQCGELTVVDNFFDWGGHAPPHLNTKGFTLIVSSEENFINSCNESYDFIVSDADHFNSHKWLDKVLNLLTPNGIIVFHDTTNDMFPNLKYNLVNSVTFNTSSKQEEQCERGLTVYFKSLNKS
jgi:predicted O-methyltransferase YrrM